MKTTTPLAHLVKPNYDRFSDPSIQPGQIIQHSDDRYTGPYLVPSFSGSSKKGQEGKVIRVTPEGDLAWLVTVEGMSYPQRECDVQPTSAFAEQPVVRPGQSYIITSPAPFGLFRR